jgi:hypothetical protein
MRLLGQILFAPSCGSYQKTEWGRPTDRCLFRAKSQWLEHTVQCNHRQMLKLRLSSSFPTHCYAVLRCFRTYSFFSCFTTAPTPRFRTLVLAQMTYRPPHVHLFLFSFFFHLSSCALLTTSFSTTSTLQAAKQDETTCASQSFPPSLPLPFFFPFFYTSRLARWPWTTPNDTKPPPRGSRTLLSFYILFSTSFMLTSCPI